MNQLAPEDQIPLIPPAGLFAHLAAALKNKGTAVLVVTAEDALLRVNLTQKAKDVEAKSSPLSLSVIATPAELDAEFPAAIGKACGRCAAPGSVADQVESQIEAAKNVTEPKPQRKAAEKPKSGGTVPKAAKKAAAFRPVKPTVKPAKTKSAPKPVAKAAASPRHKPGASEKKTRARRPEHSKEECIAELKRLYAQHGNKLTREQFIKESPTGRSFERAFGGWKQFVGEMNLVPNGKDREEPQGGATQPAAVETAAAPESLPGQWPFPDQPQNAAAEQSNSAPEAHAPAITETDQPPPAEIAAAIAADSPAFQDTTPPFQPPPAKKTREVYDCDGYLLGETQLQPTVHEVLELADSGPLKVMAIGRERITVERMED